MLLLSLDPGYLESETPNAALAPVLYLLDNICKVLTMCMNFCGPNVITSFIV